MMGFLSPWLLALGAAVAVPVILHLFQRHQGPRVLFPALRYLRRAEKEHARRIRLRQILLLALRVGALVVLALAAARPFLPSGGGGHRPTAVAIVLDNSLSSGLVTGDRRVLDVLKERALETLARARPEDRFWLIRAGSPWEAAVPGDAAAAAERVRATEVSAGAANLPAALERARALLAAGAEGRAAEIHLLSDLQATAFSGAAGPAQGERPPVVAWTPDPETPPNAAVVDVQVAGGLAPRAGERALVTAALAGVPEGDSVPVRLALDGRIAAAATSRGSAVLPFPARAAGLVEGWVEIDPDALRGDDRRHFVVRVQPPPAVAVTSPLPFLDEALQVLADAGRVRRVEPAAADVVVAPGAAGAVPRDGRTLVVFAPASPLELPAANRRLAAAGIPWRLEPPRQGGEARFADEVDDGELAPVLRGVRIREAYGLRPAAGSTDPAAGGAPGDSSNVLLRLRDGSPWAVRGALPAGGHYLLVATPLTPEASDLPTSAAMLPLLDRLVGPWASAEPAGASVLPGSRVPLPARADAVQRPDGTRESVEGGGYYVAPGAPGIYRVFEGDRAVAAFAVNPPADESDLARLPRRRLAATLDGWPLATADDPASWSRAVYRERLGREIWRPLVLLALAFLLIEGLVASAGAGRPRVPGADAGGGPWDRARRTRRRPAGRPLAPSGGAGGEA